MAPGVLVGGRKLSVLIAMDTFKGTIPAGEAVAAVARGWAQSEVLADVTTIPIADGGEGTLEAIALAIPSAHRMPVTVEGPEGVEIDSQWLQVPPTAQLPHGTAIVELAATCGIEKFNTLSPMTASTYGLGQAMLAALQRGVSRLVVAIGGSASTDGGVGMLTALGARFEDADGRPVALGGRGLAQIAKADLSGLPTLPPGGAQVLVDVSNPLFGESGAASVFGPQKGASPPQVADLDAGLARLAEVLGADPQTPGAGGAGGTGYGLLVWGAELVKGSSTIASMMGLPDLIAAADLVVTGEGSYDGQSAAGKAPDEVKRLAKTAGTPVALVAGKIDPKVDLSSFCAALSLTELAGSLEAAMADPSRWLTAAGFELAARTRQV